jgi:pimeloyl-ACP methyl ester carboxylesterase
VDPETFLEAIGACGRQLGPDADRYGSGDVAMDMEDVRAALGYDSIDLYGMSYSGVIVSAYATRYPEHVRAVVADAGVPATDPRHSWTWGMDLPKRLADVVARDCASFDPCSSTTSDASTALARLAAHVRRRPVVGVINADDADRERVVVDERELAGLAWSQSDPYLFAMAADALDEGDPQRLLDIVEDAREEPWVPAPPTQDSAGDNAAVFCNDQDFVWDRGDPVALREQKYDDALRSLDPNLFAPFSAAVWTTVFAADYCLHWPAPDHFTPAVEAGATTTAMPVLILSGDLDTSVPTRTTRELLRIFPAAAFVEIPDAFHPVSASSPCGRKTMQEFVSSLEPPAADACG